MAFFSRKSHPAYLWKLHENWRTAITRRSTLWQRHGGEWKILFHQGTIVQHP
jgi:hypothetical protein